MYFSFLLLLLLIKLLFIYTIHNNNKNYYYASNLKYYKETDLTFSKGNSPRIIGDWKGDTS